VEQSDVYLINGSAFADLSKVACKLTEKAYKQEMSVCLITNQNYEATALDDALWAFDEVSFVPHHIVTSANAGAPSESTISIVSKETLNSSSAALGDHDILIYLQTDLLETEPAAKRRLILIPNDPVSLSKARTTYKALKQRGEKVDTHDMRR
jgi:DNA polymerase-3 subunit chi